MQGYRYEYKFIITKNLAKILEHKLSLVLKVDDHSISKDNTYYIRSIYFDDYNSSKYYEKLDGVEYRKKYRIRLYNNDTNFIKLECKHKHNNLTKKESVKITKEMCDDFLKGNFDKYHIDEMDNEFLKRFITEAKNKKLIPVVIVDYERLAYINDLSDLRITFDKDVRSGGFNKDVFDDFSASYNVFDDEKIVLEVKYNDFIPEYISIILSTIPMFRQAISKFAICRSVI